MGSGTDGPNQRCDAATAALSCLCLGAQPAPRFLGMEKEPKRFQVEPRGGKRGQQAQNLRLRARQPQPSLKPKGCGASLWGGSRER